MTTLDDKLLPKVKSIIDKVGKTSAFRAPETGGYDPTTGSNPDSPNAAVNAKHSPPTPYPDRLIDGELIRVGDARIILAASGAAFTPVVGHIVTIDSQDWRAVRVDSLYSGDSIAAWELHLRRG